jgi:magnesium-transporting ATPase (P-type)
MNAESLNLPNPKGLDASQLQANLAHIQNDIHTLSGWQENDISRTFLNNLRNKEKSYQKALRKAEGKAFTLLGVGGFLTGMVLLLQRGRKGPAEKPLVAAEPASQSATEEQVFPRQRIWRAVGLGVLVLFLTSCVGFFASVIINTAQKGGATWPVGIFFLSIFVGFVGGIGVFFKSTKLLPVKPIVKAIGLALAILIGGLLLSMAVTVFFPSSSIVIGITCILAPLSAIIVFIVSMIRLRPSTP